MKKKLFLSLLCGGLVLGLATGCGNQNNKGNNNSNADSTQNNSSSKNYQIADDLKGTLEVNLSTTKYCLNTPDFTSRSASGYINNMNGYFIISDQYVDPATKIEYGIDYTDIKNSNDIMDIMKLQFIANAKTTGGLIYADSYDYVITSKENVKINGYDMTKFSGEFRLESEWPLEYNTAKFVGYSLLKNGYPIYFAVIEQPNEEKKINLEEMANKIVKSFRENDGDCYDD